MYTSTLLKTYIFFTIQIVKKLDKLSKKMKIEDLFTTIRTGDLQGIPKRSLTQENLLKCNPKDFGQYYIHIPNTPLINEIIKQGLISCIPKKTLNNRFLNKETGPHNRTIFIEIADNGYLHMLPQENITKRNCTKEDAIGNNALYHSCRTGEISLIPQKFYNEAILTKRNLRGRSCLHEAAKFGHLNKIPQDYITEETMIGSNPEKVDPIDDYYIYVIGHYKSSTNIENLLNSYGDKTLQYLKHKCLPLNCIATKILRNRRSERFSRALNSKSKDLVIL